MKKIIFALALACLALPARAQSIGEYWTQETGPKSSHAGKPVHLAGGNLLDEAKRYIGARRSPTGFRGAWCGDFMGFVARRVGASTPRDYRLAASWARAGHATSPHVGAVAVMRHHVGVIAAVSGRRVLLVSGNHGHRVAEGWYSLNRMIAIRSV